MQGNSESVCPEDYDQSSVGGDDLSGGRVIELFDTFNFRAGFSQQDGIGYEEGFMGGAEFRKELVQEGLDLGQGVEVGGS